MDSWDKLAKRVAIIGSREYPDLDAVVRLVQNLPAGTVVVSGGARGVDQTAAKAAKARGLEVREHLPDWNLHGKAAGHIRNTEIIKGADHVFAFHWKQSPGTADSMHKAEALGRTITVFRPCARCKVTLPDHKDSCPDGRQPKLF